MRHSLKNQISTEVKSVFSKYPKFVFSRNNSDILDGIPVFVYHTIDPEMFESHLRFLKNNDYKTLSVSEFYELLTGAKPLLHNRSVVLTIDDARSSVWRFAFPLLKKYQMNAVLFIIPGWTKDFSENRKNLFDVWEGRESVEAINKIDISDKTVCKWGEISEMFNSGYVNIESHTLFHREIFVGTKITDFFTSDKSFAPYNFSASAYLNAGDVGTEIKAEDYLGLPIFETSPLISGRKELIISDEFKKMCREIYLNSNEDKTENNWKTRIKNLAGKHLNAGKYFHFEPSRDDTVYDLKKAKEIIQAKLGSAAGNHLCLPWTIGTNETIDILKQLKIKSSFWGVLPDKKINKPGDDPYFISRIKNDFIFRLPGKGRKSFFSIYNNKLKRRIKGEKIF